MGINPTTFNWKLEPNTSFQTPEAVMIYTDDGLNNLSQSFHKLLLLDHYNILFLNLRQLL